MGDGSDDEEPDQNGRSARSLGEWRIGWWNARGVVPKVDALIRYCDQNDISVVAVTDTQENGDVQGECEDGWTYIPGVRSKFKDDTARPLRGLGMLSKVPMRVLHSDEHNAWFAEPADLGTMYHVGYWPNERIQNQKAAELFAEGFLKLSGSQKRVFSMGDFNCRMATFQDDVVNDTGRHLLTLAGGLDLLRPVDLGFDGLGFTRVEHRTRSSGVEEIQRSSPDGWFANRTAAKLVMNIEVLTEHFGSDHRLVTMTSKRVTLQPVTNTKRSIPSWNLARLGRLGEAINADIARRSENVGEEEGDLGEEMRLVVQTVRDAATRVLGKQTDRMKAAGKERSRRVRAAEGRMRRSERRYQDVPNAGNRLNMIAAKRNLNSVMRTQVNEKSDFEKEKLEAMQDIKDTCGFWDSCNKVFKPARKSMLPAKIIGADGIVYSEPEDVLNALGDGFREVNRSYLGVRRTGFVFDDQFKERIQAELAQFEVANRDFEGPLDFSINEKEYMRVIGKLKKGKAAGPDEIMPEFIMEACEGLREKLRRMRAGVEAGGDENPFADHMMYLYNRCLKEESMPTVLKEGAIRALFKSGETQLTGNYRPITLLPFLGKNLGSILANRLLEHLEINSALADEQAGFRKGRSTIHQLVALDAVLNDRRRKGMNTAVIFLDCAKAYDTVWKEGLLYKLWKKGVRGRFWGLVKSSLQQRTRRMKRSDRKVDSKNIREFQPEEGVTQGAPESPILYSVFIDGLIEELREQRVGVVVRNTRRPGFMFADDIALVVESADEVHRALAIVTEYARKWRFSFNGAKSAVMAWGSGRFRTRIREQEFMCTRSRVPVKSEYRYLGVLFTQNRRWNRHIEEMTTKFKVRTNRVAWKLLKGRKVRPRTAVYVWNTLVRPMAEYACALWANKMTMEQERKLEAVQTMFLKKIMNVPGGTPSVFVRLETGTERLRARWDKLSLGYLRVVASMKEGRVARDGLDLAMRNSDMANSWGSRICEMLESTKEEGRLGPTSTVQQLSTMFSQVEFSVDKREEDRSRDEVTRMRSLRLFGAVRCWDCVDSEHAHSKNTMGRVSSRHSENYLDMWSKDKEGTRLKILARANQLKLNAVDSRRNSACAVAARCVCCDQETMEDRHHFMMECPAFEVLRDTMKNKTMEALASARDRGGILYSGLSPLGFEGLEAEAQLEVLLGKRLESVSSENKIDLAVRKYLRRAWRVREGLI